MVQKKRHIKKQKTTTRGKYHNQGRPFKRNQRHQSSTEQVLEKKSEEGNIVKIINNKLKVNEKLFSLEELIKEEEENRKKRQHSDGDQKDTETEGVKNREIIAQDRKRSNSINRILKQNNTSDSIRKYLSPAVSSPSTSQPQKTTNQD